MSASDEAYAAVYQLMNVLRRHSNSDISQIGPLCYETLELASHHGLLRQPVDMPAGLSFVEPPKLQHFFADLRALSNLHFDDAALQPVLLNLYDAASGLSGSYAGNFTNEASVRAAIRHARDSAMAELIGQTDALCVRWFHSVPDLTATVFPSLDCLNGHTSVQFYRRPLEASRPACLPNLCILLMLGSARCLSRRRSTLSAAELSAV